MEYMVRGRKFRNSLSKGLWLGADGIVGPNTYEALAKVEATLNNSSNLSKCLIIH